MDVDQKLYAWTVCYSGIVAFQYHPRNPVDARMSLQECATVADGMLIEVQRRYVKFCAEAKR
jgi:hypothetical protein